jgi:hypothetical protein
MDAHRIEVIQRIVDFLRGIGLTTLETELPPDTFLPGIRIDGGILAWDPDQLKYAGDLLHEAGHLAILPPTLRATANAKILESFPNAELGAVAWSYAASLHLGLALEIVFHDHGYQGHATGIRRTISLGLVPGLPVLEAAGMAASRHHATTLGCQPFPRMRHWLRQE